MHLFEKTESSELIFDGKIITVKKDTARLENDEIVSRELVVHPGGVCVVPINDNNEILMVKQFRYPFQTVLTEIPAGKLEVGGVHGVLYPSVAYLTEKIHMYMATGLTFDKQHLDDDEFLDVVKVPFEKAVEMVMNGELPDAKTQCAILKAARLMNN